MSKGPFTPEGELWVLAGNGQPYWPAEPKIEDVDLDVIVWSLAQKVRFGGHGRQFYSVAQHSVFVSDLTQFILRDTLVAEGAHEEEVRDQYIRDVSYHALFHDAHEAYLADIPSPIKKLPWLEPEWRKLEDAWDKVIFKEFGVKNDPVIRVDVKVSDLTAMYVEGHRIMPPTPGDWDWPGHGSTTPKIKTYGEKYGWLLAHPMNPEEAKELFVDRLETF